MTLFIIVWQKHILYLQILIQVLNLLQNVSILFYTFVINFNYAFLHMRTPIHLCKHVKIIRRIIKRICYSF